MGHTKTRPQNYPYLSDVQIELGVLSLLWHPGTEEGVAAEAQRPGIPKQMLSRSKNPGDRRGCNNKWTSLPHKFGLLQRGSMLEGLEGEGKRDKGWADDDNMDGRTDGLRSLLFFLQVLSAAPSSPHPQFLPLSLLPSSSPRFSSSRRKLFAL